MVLESSSELTTPDSETSSPPWLPKPAKRLFARPPVFTVNTGSALRKLTRLPLPSVMMPLASIPASRLCASSHALSTFSSRTTAYGFLLTSSVSLPPSSLSRKPLGLPMSVESLPGSE